MRTKTTNTNNTVTKTKRKYAKRNANTTFVKLNVPKNPVAAFQLGYAIAVSANTINAN